MTGIRLSAAFISFFIGTGLIRYGIQGADWIGAGSISALITSVFLGFIVLTDLSRKKRRYENQKLPFFKGETRLAASLQEAIIIVDDLRRMVHINPAAYRLFPDIKAGESIMSVSNNDLLSDLVDNALNDERPVPFVYQIYDPVERHIRVTGSFLRPEPVLDEKSRAAPSRIQTTGLCEGRESR